MSISRRDFLRLSAIGLGVSATSGALLSPFGFPSRARAASGLAGEAGGAIIIVLNGGARTQCLFNGTVGGGANPFGSVAGLRVPLSAVMQDTGLDTPALNDRVNLVTACQHHTRTGSHDPGRTVACTGYSPEEDKPGILTILNRSFAYRDVPCINIGNDTPTTNIGSEISSTFSPIKIRSALDVREITASLVDARVSEEEKSRIETLREAMQDRFLRDTPYDAPADIPFFQRRAVEVAQQFSNDALDIRTDASMGRYFDGSPVSNVGLRNSLEGGDGLGGDAMVALRLRQLGCAGITISTGNWDMHSNEETSMPRRGATLGRVIAGLVDQMSRIENPLAEGVSLLDTTVITVLTDFNRGNWSNASGFNGNRGSDHRGGDDKTSYQCIPIIGGGLPGGKVLGQVGNDGSPVGSSDTYETRQVLATVLDLVGIPPSLYLPDNAVALTEELTS